ncbi:hypothetical protein [Sanyastnella coralliicola]|uniref:hypothetical protein n=1 Tax=Sanyastnella coralliicola TaxID=3069118 RepID=UPI0027B8DD0A|nr:hypothetical protein [Longitalea sp. SCSIO 12813]
MKNKAMTIVALVAVLIIWGLIAYRLFFQGEGPQVTWQMPDVEMSADTYEPMKEYQLIGDYRDPFLGKRRRPSSSTTTSTPVSKPKPQNIILEPEVPWPQVEYRGVNNAQGGDPLIFLRINGVDQLGFMNEPLQGITPIEVYRDSIILEFNEERKTFIR